MAIQHTGSSPADTQRLTWLTGALMVAAALAIFAAAYGVGGLFGRAADDKARDVDARIVAAEEPSGTSDLTLRAQNVAFDTKEILVPAGRPTVIRLNNEDAGILHNIAVYRDAQVSDLITRGKLFDGPRTRDYRFDAFEPGTYYFQCDLHPSMNGVLRSE